MKQPLDAPAWTFSPKKTGKDVKHLGATGAAMPRIKQNEMVWGFFHGKLYLAGLEMPMCNMDQ